MSALLLIDLSAIYWQAWHSQRDEDEPTGPRDVTVSRVERLIASHAKLTGGNGSAIVCVDDAASWRRELSPEYKANRAAKPPAASVQLQEATKMLASKWNLQRAAKCEADDVIATLARAHAGPVMIATADKDLWQLVSERVEVLTTHTREPERIGVAEVVAKYGVEPRLVRDWLALVGDASDNVRGVKGVGEKTATGLLQTYGSIIGVMAAAESGDAKLAAKPALMAALLEARPAVTLALELVSLRTDAPVERVTFNATKRADAPRAEPSRAADNQPPPDRPRPPPAESTRAAPGRVVRDGDVVSMPVASATTATRTEDPMRMQTDDVGAIAAAIVRVQSTMRTANRESTNPHFRSRYADLAEIVDVLREPMAAAGIAYVQTTRIGAGGPVLRTTIVHTSGQWIAGEYPLEPTKPRDPQALGAALTYARRYALAAMMGVVADEDDDGNRASGNGGRR